MKKTDILSQFPELKEKLAEAIATGHFMVTVHCQLKRPETDGDLQHYLFECGYPRNDIVNSLKHIATVHGTKINPAADTAGTKNWV